MSNSKNFCETDFLLKESAQIIDYCDITYDTNKQSDSNINKNININRMKRTDQVPTDQVPRPTLVVPNLDNYVIHSEDSETERDDNNIIDQNKHQNKNKDLSNISIDIKDAVHYDTENDKKSLVTKKKTISYNLNLCFAITGGGLFALTMALVYNYL